jgi:hypothetical protein
MFVESTLIYTAASVPETMISVKTLKVKGIMCSAENDAIAEDSIFRRFIVFSTL